MWRPGLTRETARSLRRKAALAGLVLVLVAASAGACQRVDGDAFEKDPPPIRPPTSAEEEDDGLDDDGLPPEFSSEGETYSEEEGDTVLPDTGFMPTATQGAGMCPKVDILFVIDNSFSMAAEQENLAQSYAGFIAGIEDSLEDSNDFHLGVVTSDAYDFNPAPCDTLGDLVTASPLGSCGPYALGPYMSGGDDLSTSFVCAAKVGTEGDPDEQMLAAALAALEPQRSAQGACNEGFSRDDALLVLVLISDEDDDPETGGSPGDPDMWASELVALKGYESNAVVLSIVGVDGPNACGSVSPDPGRRIGEFTTQFSYSGIADVCEDDYAPFFSDALSLVYAACQGFTPPG